MYAQARTRVEAVPVEAGRVEAEQESVAVFERMTSHSSLWTKSICSSGDRWSLEKRAFVTNSITFPAHCCLSDSIHFAANIPAIVA
jgi:hypothetical protein